MQLAKRQRLQNQEIQRPLQQIAVLLLAHESNTPIERQ
jgi:hypothetical protein